jgi:uncharacterized iron-regulated membrane protein
MTTTAMRQGTSILKQIIPTRPNVEPKHKQANWLQSPQRVWLRRALFQVHLWVGVLLAAYAFVIGITGSVLVFKEEIEHQMWPAVFQVASGPRQITIQESVNRIQGARPGWVPFALRDFTRPNEATTVLMRRTNAPSTPNYREVSFNPYTGQVLLDRLRYAGLLGWIDNLHVYLLSGQSGLRVSGAMALGLLILCLTGIVLWWPGVKRWSAALVLNPKARWRRLNWDLHSVVGFWSCVALLVVTFTGIDFAFPDAVGNFVELATSGSLSVQEAQATQPKPKLAVNDAPIMTIDEAMEAARRGLPQAAPAGYMSLPANSKSPYHVTGYYTGALPYSQLVRMTLDPHTGAVLYQSDTRNETLGSRVEQSFTTIHFGSFGGSGVLGVIVKLIWVLLGIVPALLAVTGLIMYWNRKLRPAWLRMKRAGLH